MAGIASDRKPPLAALGTMTFGGQTDMEEAARIVAAFVDHSKSVGVERPIIDSAALYQAGRTEEILGHALKKYPRSSFRILSKINPWCETDFTKWHEEGLSPSRMRKQLETTLKRLQMASLDILLVHAPDPNRPIEEVCETMGAFVAEGKTEAWGLSNFPAWQVAIMHSYCDRRGLPTPRFYQGMYNPFTRGVEMELLPCLKKLGIAFMAYNCLAGGIFTAKYNALSRADVPQEGRFAAFKPYVDRFWHAEYLDGMQGVVASLGGDTKAAMTAAFKFMKFHSAMSEKFHPTEPNYMILGATDASQFAGTVAAFRGDGMLSDDVLEAIEAGAKKCHPVCPKYFRP